MSQIRITRLADADVAIARTVFTTMAHVFETEMGSLSDTYLNGLLARRDFWALAATVEGQVVGGLTAHTLPQTRAEVSEIFIYDLAVVPEWQRHGVGRELMSVLRAEAAREGITVTFVPADNEDRHALEFYQAIGGAPSPATIFTFGGSAS